MTDLTWRRHGALLTALWTAGALWMYPHVEWLGPLLAAAAVFTGLRLLTESMQP